MLELIKAKDLQKKGLFGKPDPYLKIVFCDKKFVSPVMKNNANPEWKYPIEFNIEENSPKEIKSVPCGSFYVSLTRVKEGKNVFLKSFEEKYITTNKRVEEKIKSMRVHKTYNFKKIYIWPH